MYRYDGSDHLCQIWRQPHAVTRLIRDHNRVNGLWFSVVEFLLMTVLCLGMAVLFIDAGAVVFGVVAAGIGANCVVIVVLGVGSLRAGEPDIGLRAAFTPSGRARMRAEYPHLQRETFVLAGATLLPGIVAAWTVVERLQSR